MKSTILKLALLAIATAVASLQAIEVPCANGSDGPLIVTESITIDLSKAKTRAWDSAPEEPGEGVYDPERWAVVFKYSSVRINPGTFVKFANHPSRAPVVWLVEGEVIIGGRVELSGENGGGGRFPEPGPGGFRGGRGGDPGHMQPSGGFGAGGGRGNWEGALHVNNASHVIDAGEHSGPAYGLLDKEVLMGGSGGGGREGHRSYSGGAGAGAILIASQTEIKIDGEIVANGGNGHGTGGGSGGKIRLVAEEISGDGEIYAKGGLYWGTLAYASPGLITLEAVTFSGELYTFPTDSRIIHQPPGFTPVLWPETRARVVSVDSLPAPTDPRSSLSVTPADVLTGTPGIKKVLIETMNFPTVGEVTLFVIPAEGNRSSIQAEFLSGDYASAIWEANVEFRRGSTALQVHAVSQP